jgi:hypothetical protein
MTDPEFDIVIGTVRDSTVYRVVHGTVMRCRIGAADSAALGRLRRLPGSITSLSTQQRIQTAASAVAVAALAHLAIRQLLPAYATSGLPWWWNVAIGVVAATVASAARPIATAWADSAPVKLWRRLSGYSTAL